jgi:PAS domain S-box-containing protein
MTPRSPGQEGFGVGGDAEEALNDVAVPSYVLDTVGVVRWINPAAEQLLGDIRGKHYTSVVAGEDRLRAREVFARKVLGTVAATETTGVLVSTDGKRLTVELSAVALKNGEQVVGVFGIVGDPRDEQEPAPPDVHLTPRQTQVLRLLRRGYSTKQIAEELHLTTDTVRDHLRKLYRALGVHSRLEAVTVGRPQSDSS